MVPERPPLEIASAVNKVFIDAVERSVVWPGEVIGGMGQRLVEQWNPEDDHETEVDRAANPAASPRTSEDKRSIVCLSFLMAIHLPLFSGVTLRDGVVTLYGGISLTRNFIKPILTRMLAPWRRTRYSCASTIST